MTAGPLTGLRVVEFAGLGPAPFCATMLSDLGADVLRINRPGTPERPADLLTRGRSSIILDLKTDEGKNKSLEALRRADIVVEGFRPGTMERFGLGPRDVAAANPRLIYARITGWGQEGPLANKAGHDINFIALAGALAYMGKPDAPPAPPLNLVGDFGGGALYAVVGILAALHARQCTGRGQVLDIAMVDGVANMLAMLLSHYQGSRPNSGFGRGSYFLDGSAPFYRCYECADRKWIAVGAIEPVFWKRLLERLDMPAEESQAPVTWRATSDRLEKLFRSRTRNRWVGMLQDEDVCVSPVLDLEEAAAHPHLAARRTYVSADGLLQPAAAPRFSLTPASISGPPPSPEGGELMLRRWYSERAC